MWQVGPEPVLVFYGGTHALIALFLVEIVFGIINRAAPQINVFILSQPVKVAVGVLMVLIVLQVLVDQFDSHGQSAVSTLFNRASRRSSQLRSCL